MTVSTSNRQSPPPTDIESKSDSSPNEELSQAPDFDGHPRRWGRARKIYDTCLIILLEFYTARTYGKAYADSQKTPVAAHIYRDLGVSPVLSTFLFISTYDNLVSSIKRPRSNEAFSYLIGQAIGGVFLPPWSESFGRKKLYVVSTGIYSLTCILIAASATIPAIVVGRVVGGFLSSIPTIVAAGSIEDLWDTQDRVWWIFWWALVANLGLLAGSVISDLIIEHAHWKWVFYTAAIVNGCMTILLLTIKESRPSVVASNQTSMSKAKKSSFREKLDIVRPLRLLFTEPIVFLVATISAIAFGLIYLFTDVLPIVYVSLGLDDGWKNTPFLALGVGVLASVFTRIYDARVLAARSAKGRPITPESKLAGFLIGSPLLAGGLWVFAWTIPPGVSVHWAIPTVALVPIGYAVNEYDYVLAGYLTDCYKTYTASAFAALALTRALLCATFPLFGSVLFSSIDHNKGTSIFAALATLLCMVPPLLLRYGSRLRERSKFIGE